MRTSFYLTRFLTLLPFFVFPLYLALRASAWLSEVGTLLPPISERGQPLHLALTSLLTAPRAPISKEALEASAEHAEFVRESKIGRSKEYLSSLPGGLAHCINSLEQYPFLAEQVLQRKHARYATQTPTQKTLSKKLGYPAHFERARKGIEVNARFSRQLAQLAREDYRTGPQSLEDEEEAEFGVVNVMFGHLVRDWSTQGAKERQTAFPPVLDGLEQHFGGKGNGRGKRVLMPGSGMGGLASDVADLGPSITSRGGKRGLTHLRRVRRYGQRAGLRLHPGLPLANESHELAAPAYPATLCDQMDTSG